MQDSITTGLQAVNSLSSEMLMQIEELAEICNQAEKLDLKLNWKTLRSRSGEDNNDFLYYDNGKLIGFLPLFWFNAQEAEISGMVHPDYRRRGIFSTLYRAAYTECQRRKIPAILLIVERISASGQGFVQTLPVQYHHSEYKMLLQAAKPAFKNPQPSSLCLRSAIATDVPMLQLITATAFDIPLEAVDWYTPDGVVESSDMRYYVAELDGKCIGKLDVQISEQGAFILGFGVLPEWRGRGYGKQLLQWTIQQLQQEQIEPVALEVMVENEQALSLYTSSGFTTTGCYDYYQIVVK